MASALSAERPCTLSCSSSCFRSVGLMSGRVLEARRRQCTLHGELAGFEVVLEVSDYLGHLVALCWCASATAPCARRSTRLCIPRTSSRRIHGQPRKTLGSSVCCCGARCRAARRAHGPATACTCARSTAPNARRSDTAGRHCWRMQARNGAIARLPRRIPIACQPTSGCCIE